MDDWKTIAAFLSPLVAIVAIAVNYFVVKKQIAATVLSNERKEWINTLRTDVASFDANVIALISAHAYHQKMQNESSFIYLQEQINTLKMIHTKINILLDLDSQPQKKLHDALAGITGLLLDSMENVSTNDFNILFEAIVPLTRSVISQELSGIKELR